MLHLLAFDVPFPRILAILSNMGMGANKEAKEMNSATLADYPLVLQACDTSTLFCSLLHVGVQQKGFALWAGPHMPRPACCCCVTVCKTGQFGFSIR